MINLAAAASLSDCVVQPGPVLFVFAGTATATLHVGAVGTVGRVATASYHTPGNREAAQ